eukprot:7200456-Pyramimonas_sp.AAC.1
MTTSDLQRIGPATAAAKDSAASKRGLARSCSSAAHSCLGRPRLRAQVHAAGGTVPGWNAGPRKT